MICKICNIEEIDLKKFSNHLNGKHKISSIEYTIKFLYDNIRPKCPQCGEDTRYITFEFKEYCKQHGNIKMSKAGSIGGKSPAWNRGKTKNDDERLASYSKRVSGENNHFWGRNHTTETILKISEKKRLGLSTLEERVKKRENEFELITNHVEYKFRQGQYLEFKCKECKTVQKKTLQAFERGSLCEICYPNNHSKWELEVYNFVYSINKSAKLGDRTVIRPKEIDIYVEDKAFGIECHGLYFHSGDDVKKNAHSLKAKLTRDAGVNLLQVFWDEWRDKRQIVESMIRYRIGKSTNKIGARKCLVIDMDTKQQKDFFNSSHISGWVASKKCWGLIYNGKIVAALSIRSPRQKKWIEYLEVSRYSQANDTSVVGALSKLICEAEKYAHANGYKGLMTYVDRRIGDGSGYEKSGFRLLSKTTEDYWYTDGTCRYDRFKFRASGGKTESQIATEMKVQKIYGAGNFILTKDIIRSPSV